MAGKFVENYKKRFVNPYNFIPLMESCSRSVPTAEFEDCYTGYFDCRIKLLTPLFIPNTSSSSRLLSEEEKKNEKCKDEKWKGYDFYSYDDWSAEEWEGKGLPLPPQNPVIPGSEIRGALRSVFEAAFNGCMSSVSAGRVLSERTNKAKKLPACLGRKVFTKTVEDLLKENGGYDPCADEKLCPACQVFGMVGKSGNGKAYARASKVRVTDAVLVDPARDIGELFEEPVVLPELGEPKPGTVEFYTEPPYEPSEKWKKGQGFWTYDYKYKVQNNKNPSNMRILSVREPKLRGRKYYWHSQVDLERYRGNQLSAMKQRIRPMKAVGRDEEPLFRFRVYFERLNRTQLNQLKWAIDFGNPACAHKIGRAKPLGFGSVRLSIDNLYLREIDKGTGIWEMKRETNIDNFFSHPVEASEALKIVQKMANWEERPRNVQYPSVDPGSHGTPYKKNETASHQWFKENKKDGYFMKVLPKADEDARKNLESEKALYTYTRNKN